MAVASLFSGLALANARLGAVHGIAGPLGGISPVPHGIACAALLPHVMKANIRSLSLKNPESGVMIRFQTIARILTGRENALAEDSVIWIQSICKELGIPRLSVFGFKPSQIQELAEKAKRASSMKGNPVELSVEEISQIIGQAL